MSRKAPRSATLKLLYARSGNECAFPGCNHPIFSDNGVYIAQLCHIESAENGGERYNEKQTDEERNSFSNLLFMCHRHHKETNNTLEYTGERLKQIKKDHEKNFTEQGKEASAEMIRQILFEINYFWKKQTIKKFKVDELIMHIKTIENYCDMMADSDSEEVLEKDLVKLLTFASLDFRKVNEVPYFKNPFVGRNWEIHNIGRPNYFAHLKMCINQLKVIVFEELYKCDPENQELQKQLDISRTNFEEIYDNTYYVD